MTTGKRIAKARKRQELTQEGLAEKLGVTAQAISSWERDEYLPDTKNLVALADKLDVTLDSLLREDNGWEMGPVNCDPDRMFTFVKGRAQVYCLPQTLAVMEILRPAHGGDPRWSKYGFDTVYTVHPLTMACHALAMGLHDDDVIAAALAHDMLEDSGLRIDEIPAGERVREAVRLVSKNLCREKYGKGWEEKYFEDIRENPLACLVKCLDRVHNLHGMADAFDRAGMVKYTAETDRYYPELLAVIKKVPEWNNAWWLLRYQMTGLLETFKRML